MSRLLFIALASALVLHATPPRRGTFTLEVDGQRLHAQRQGKGPDLLLLHGGLSSSEDFATVRATLEQDFAAGK